MYQPVLSVSIHEWCRHREMTTSQVHRKVACRKVTGELPCTSGENKGSNRRRFGDSCM
ncbi:hypothetical protein BDQ12DRAFT_684526 [Crucibulum laeve]|uniref:Uncharacterized protein n=1 Tax=Crucibulum laeve TaxID=68775 RepID=A0A5C3LYT8_9AGAR|nr:hypothetical protein BDQ12DRAFT_684526 [Crucibulum laeve]